MKRFDLRHLGADFEGRMCELVEQNLAQGEVGIFIFEIGDFSGVEKSANLVARNGWTLMNSLRFNEVDWTIIIKKAPLDSKIAESAKNAESSPNSTQNAESVLDSAKIAESSANKGDSNA